MPEVIESITTKNHPEYLCENCDWIGLREEMLWSLNPFDAFGDIYGCPECRCIDPFVFCCDISGCKEEATCGLPTKTKGYLMVCSKHYSELKSNAD